MLKVALKRTGLDLRTCKFLASCRVPCFTQRDGVFTCILYFNACFGDSVQRNALSFDLLAVDGF